MIILGVDPGIAITGYALIQEVHGSAHILDYGLVETGRSVAFSLRLKLIYDKIYQVIDLYRPQSLALEEVFYSKNVQTALKMGHARGVTLLAAVNQGIATSEYSPREIKQAVTGNGAASKQQVQKMVMQLLKLSQPPGVYDVTDAMAVAICHCHRLSKGI